MFVSLDNDHDYHVMIIYHKGLRALHDYLAQVTLRFSCMQAGMEKSSKFDRHMTMTRVT